MARSQLREEGEDDHRVNPIELFFDLVFVFAVTQLSHYVLEHHDLLGLLQAVVMFLAMWWAWIFTAWATNWLNPQRAPVRLMLSLVMLVSLAMSSSIPKAFDKLGLVFASSYVAIQVGRTLYTAWAKQELRRGTPYNLVRATFYFLASAPLWLVGGVDPDPARRVMWWAAALAIEYAGPMLYFRMPVLGASRTEEWDISGEHMAERCGLFIIIALGEGILVTGATFTGLEPTPATIAALITAFTGSIAMWWLYFDIGAERGTKVIEQEAHPGRIGREAYTYGHIPIVGGIIALAVFDEIVLAHPTDPLEPFTLGVVIGGAFLFVGGNALFKRLTNKRGNWPLSHLVGLVLLAPMAVWAWELEVQPLSLAIACTALLILIAVWEWGSFHGGWKGRWLRLAGRD